MDGKWGKSNMRNRKRNMISKIKKEFPKIKILELIFFADVGKNPVFEYGYTDDGVEISEDVLDNYINLTKNWIEQSVFDCSKYPIINERFGCGGNIRFYLDDNKVEYTVCYYNNPNDINDLDYHDDRTEII